ncbi:MAG TPA: DUF5946 family protein [Thermomicrobiales bacterium]|jgi:hypothetical protein
MDESADQLPCNGCGLVIAGGADGCRALYEATIPLSGRVPTYFGAGRLAFDTYCVQHPAVYCVSAKSLAAHLGGLCWGLEYGGGERGYERLRRSLDGVRRDFPKPPLPDHRGGLTIADLAAADDAALGELIEAWAHATWAAYADLHDWARERVAAALKP